MSKAKYVLKIVTDLKQLSNRADELMPDAKMSGVKRLVRDLKETLKANPQAVALGAQQIGVNKRVFCLRFSDGQIKTFANPMITHKEGLHLSRETSLSIPGQEYIIPRHDYITAIYQNENGAIQENKFEGTPCEVFEQMNDMLDGILLSDYGLPIDKKWDKASEEEKQEVIKMYKEWLKQFDENLSKEIEETPVLHDIKMNMEYMASVARGETEVVPTYNGVADDTQSTKKMVEEQNKLEKERIDKIIQKYVKKESD